MFPDGALVNFDAQWLLEHTDVTDDAFPCSFIVGARQGDRATIYTGANPSANNQPPYYNTGVYGQSQDDHAAHIAAKAKYGNVNNLGPYNINVAQQTFMNAGAFYFNTRAVRVSGGTARSDDAIDLAVDRGRALQLATAFGTESNLVFFEPNDFKLTADSRDRNPTVVYCVWEVWDDEWLEHASRSFARLQIQDLVHQDMRTSLRRGIEELEFKLSKKNLKNGQILAAWVPSARLYTALERMDIATDHIGTQPAGVPDWYEQRATRGHRPLYPGSIVDRVTPEVTGDGTAFDVAERITLWNANAVTTSHNIRAALQREIMINMNRATKFDLWRTGPAGNTTIGQFEALRRPGGPHAIIQAIGTYYMTELMIPRGTRIRLKTFKHVGIRHGTHCFGARANPYTQPLNVADACLDFDWSEDRGRFPYQVIPPRADNFSGVRGTPSKQGFSGFVYEDAIKNIQLSWRQQPELVCEWVVLPPAKVQAAYRLAYPQHEFFRALFPAPTFTLPKIGETKEIAIRGVKLNEVPNKVYVYCMLTERSRNYLEWLDCKCTIQNLETQINETVDTTSHIPLWLGYRMYKENCPYSQKTKDEWVNDNCWVLSPQNLNISAETFTESMARVSTISIKATVSMNRAYRQIASNYSPALFPGLPETGKSVMEPEFEMRVVVAYDNHSLVMNSRHEMLIEKNVLATRGPTGLVREDRGLPRQGGLAFY